MSRTNFHSLYVAPLIVTILGTIIVGVAAYLNPQTSGSIPAQASTFQPTREVATSVPAKEVKFPKDAATESLLREFLVDAAAATAKYQGKEVQVCSVIALVEPAGVLELYGASEKNQVEGIYFKCRLQEKAAANALERNRLVTLNGKVAGYVHHRKSPHILLESCCLLER